MFYFNENLNNVMPAESERNGVGYLDFHSDVNPISKLFIVSTITTNNQIFLHDFKIKKNIAKMGYGLAALLLIEWGGFFIFIYYMGL